MNETEIRKNCLFPEKLPLATRWGFINASFAKVLAEMKIWREKIFQGTRYNETEANALSEMIEFLLPLNSQPGREFLIETKSKEWTAYFDNNRGGDPTPPVSYLSERMGCQAITLMCHPYIDVKLGLWGGVEFLLMGPGPSFFQNYQRAVRLVAERKKFLFVQQGEPLPFEQIDKYNIKSKRDRFTPQMLIEYCRYFGLDPLNPEFYCGRVCLIQKGIWIGGP